MPFAVFIIPAIITFVIGVFQGFKKSPEDYL